MYIVLFSLEMLFLYLLSRSLQVRLSRFIFLLTKSKKLTIWLMAVLFLPGTFVHEMSHFLAALFTLTPVGEVDLLPKYQEKRIRLGSVKVGNVDPFRSFIIAAAPFLMGNLILFLSLNYLLDHGEELGIYLILVILYLLLAVVNTMFLSKKDFIGVWRLILTFCVFYIVFYYCGLRIPKGNINLLISKIGPVFEIVDLFLLIPIIADGLVVGILTLAGQGVFEKVLRSNEGVEPRTY